MDVTPWTRHGDASIKNQRKDYDDEFMNFHFRRFGGKISIDMNF